MIPRGNRTLHEAGGEGGAGECSGGADHDETAHAVSGQVASNQLNKIVQS